MVCKLQIANCHTCAKFFKFPVEVDVNILELITQDILVSEKISFIKIGEGDPRDQILTPIGPLK